MTDSGPEVDSNVPVEGRAMTKGRRLRWQLAAVAALLAVLIAVDWWAANRETDALLSRVEESEAAMHAFTAAAEGDPAVARLNAYASGQAPDKVVADAEAAFSDLARRGRGELLVARAALDDVTVMPWHRDVAAARAAYVDHSRAWTDYLDDLAADPTTAEDNGDISATFTIAERRLADAVPLTPLFDQASRLEAIFDESDTSSR